MNKEIPPRDDESAEKLQTPENERLGNLSPDEQQEHLRSIETIQQQKISQQIENDEKERVFEAEHGKKIFKLTKEAEEEARKFTVKGDSLGTSDAFPAQENMVWQKPEIRQKTWFGKLWEKMKSPAKKAVMTGAFVAGGLAATAGGHEKNPEDSTNTVKPKNEKGIHIENSAEVSSKLRHDWNDYVDWLDGMGLKGSESLDHNDLGGAMIDRYKKEHPGTSVSRENIRFYQSEMAKYREWVIGEIEAGRAQFRSKADEAHFLERLSKVDNIAGHLTTSVKFPHEYLVTITTKTVDYNAVANKALKDPDAKMTNIMKDDVKVTDVKDIGFAKRGTRESGKDNVATK